MTTVPSPRQSLERALTGGFQVDTAQLSDSATLDDLGLDSLAVVELIDILAAELGRTLADDALNRAMTLGEIVTALHESAP
ncbi:acyl carrier protein [Kitasatospora misakiensis]|uniref:Acyl carrier protein n=1 Tax=Kitasatospora misakiensis TaxID=67330 RepID=A0ABW0XDI7_9ACTN